MMAATFSITHRVQFSETDMAGVVHFSNYFRWMEEVEHAFFRHLGHSVAMVRDDAHIGWPRVLAACEYFAPCRFEDQVELHLRVVGVSEKSLTYEVDFLKDGQKLALGRIKCVCCRIGPGGMKAIPIPPPIRETLTAVPGKTPADRPPPT